MRPIFALLLVPVIWGVLSVPAPAQAAPAAPASGYPVTAPVTAPGSGTSTLPSQPQASTTPGATNVTNVTNNNVTLPALPSIQDLAGGIFQQILILLLTGLADALQAVIGQALGAGGPGGGGFITSTPPGITYGAGAVQDLWGKVRLAADASLALTRGLQRRADRVGQGPALAL